jgi:hypothetical protein
MSVANFISRVVKVSLNAFRQSHSLHNFVIIKAESGDPNLRKSIWDIEVPYNTKDGGYF